MPAAQVLQAPPPQSTSDSLPFLILSVQAAATQVPAWQILDTQSVAALHLLEVWHGVHVAPPQSASVSAPFLTPSVHEATAQTPAWHTDEAQSAWALHCLPSAQALQAPPPQSVSVSAPFFLLSVQLGSGGASGNGRSGTAASTATSAAESRAASLIGWSWPRSPDEVIPRSSQAARARARASSMAVVRCMISPRWLDDHYTGPAGVGGNVASHGYIDRVR